MERMKAILTLTAALAFAAGPFWFPGFRGFDPALYPIPQADPPVQPAGYAFAIWGVIYPWLIVHALYGLLRRDTDAGWDATRWPLMTSLVIGAAWLGVAIESPGWASVLILVMLAGALAALFAAARRGGDRWVLGVPLGLFAGWLTAAAWVSVGLSGAGYAILGLGQGAWTVAALLGAMATAAAVQARLPGVPAYGLAVIWALVAVVVQNLGSAGGVAALAGLGAAGLGWLLARQAGGAGRA
jgi:hypothetical protein